VTRWRATTTAGFKTRCTICDWYQKGADTVRESDVELILFSISSSLLCETSVWPRVDIPQCLKRMTGDDSSYGCKPVRLFDM
jgi:hypothetical protein